MSASCPPHENLSSPSIDGYSAVGVTSLLSLRLKMLYTKYVLKCCFQGGNVVRTLARRALVRAMVAARLAAQAGAGAAGGAAVTLAPALSLFGSDRQLDYFSDEEEGGGGVAARPSPRPAHYAASAYRQVRRARTNTHIIHTPDKQITLTHYLHPLSHTHTHTHKYTLAHTHYHTHPKEIPLIRYLSDEAVKTRH